MQSTERIAGCLIRQRCSHCSWQLTKGPHGLLLFPGTVDVILCHDFSGMRWWKTIPLGGTVITLASIRLASVSNACLVNCCNVAAYTEWAVARALRWRASALFVHQVPFRAHRSVMPIAQSSIWLIVMRRSTPSLTRHLSCGAWVPAKSGEDH